MAVIQHLENILRHFRPTIAPIDFELIKTGNINETYIVSFPEEQLILQRINNTVFKDPIAVMENISIISTVFTRHLNNHFIAPIKTTTGSNYFTDTDNMVWRVFPFIKNFPVQKIDSDACHKIGYVFGKFIHDLNQVEIEKIKPTISNFHELPFYFKQFKTAVQYDVKGRCKKAAKSIETVFSKQSLVTSFSRLNLPIRLTHNDAKIDNVLFKNDSHTDWCVIDYDTIMPGYAIFDYGDLVRSFLEQQNTSIEDSNDKVAINTKFITSIKKGFVAGLQTSISSDEIELLDKGVELIVYEQAVRFLTDYLSGDNYYRIDYPDHNLKRAKLHLAI